MASIASFTPRAWRQVPCTWLDPSGAVGVDFRFPGIEVDCWLEHQARRYPQRALLVEEHVWSIGHFSGLEEISAKLKGRHLARRPI